MLTPWRLAFVESDDSFWWLIVDTLMDSLFCVDIGINFFTVYTNQFEDYVTDRRKIAYKYLKGWFIFDVISVLPINYFVSEGEGVNDLARMARLTKLYKMIKIFRIVKQSGKLRKYAQEMLRIGMVVERSLTFLLGLTIITHVLACMWYFLSKWQNFTPDTWVVRTGYQDESDFRIYMY